MRSGDTGVYSSGSHVMIGEAVMGIVGLVNGDGSGDIAVYSNKLRPDSIILITPTERNIKASVKPSDIQFDTGAGKGWHFRVRFTIDGTTSSDTRARAFFLILNPSNQDTAYPR